MRNIRMWFRLSSEDFDPGGPDGNLWRVPMSLFEVWMMKVVTQPLISNVNAYT